jgi:hypothetical protein
MFLAMVASDRSSAPKLLMGRLSGSARAAINANVTLCNCVAVHGNLNITWFLDFLQREKHGHDAVACRPLARGDIPALERGMDFD